MQDKPDPYQTLNVPRDASDKQIKNAYRKLALKYHPDMAKKHGRDPKTAEEKFKQIGEAYSILSNPEKRKLYDQFGWVGLQQGFAEAYGNAGPQGRVYYSTGSPLDFDPFEIFSQFFGFQNIDQFNRNTRNRKKNVRSTSNKSNSFFDESINDDFFNIFNMGSNSPFSNQTYPRTGTYSSANESTLDRKIPLKLTLEEAFNGTKKIIRIKPTNQDIRITIPPKIANGTTLKIRSAGATGSFSSTQGDLYVVIDIEPSNGIRIEDSDIIYPIHISHNPFNKEQNKKILLPDKSILNVKIPKGIKVGAKLRIKGKGMRKKDDYGDLLIEIK